MIFYDQEEKERFFCDRKWFTSLTKLNRVSLTEKEVPHAISEKEMCLGAYLIIYYKDDTSIRMVLPFEHYHNIRSFVESVWAEEGVLRITADSVERETWGSYSIPTKNIRFIDWRYWYGPIEHMGNPENFLFTSISTHKKTKLSFEQVMQLAYKNLNSDFKFRV